MSKSAEILTRPPDVSFTTRLVTPPAALYLAPEDNIEITSRNSLAGVTLAAQGRFLGTDGRLQPFRFDHTPTSNRAQVVTAHRLGEGFLLNLFMIITAGTPRRGQTFGRVLTMQGLETVRYETGVLLQGYIATDNHLAYPLSPQEHSLSGPGMLRSITGTNPAAGVEISETVPTAARWRLASMRAQLVTDATVASRRPQLIVDDGTTELFRVIPNVTQAASTTKNWQFLDSFPSTGFDLNDAFSNLPPGLFVFAGWRIRTSTIDLAAGDNWGAPQLLVEEWIEP